MKIYFVFDQSIVEAGFNEGQNNIDEKLHVCVY